MSELKATMAFEIGQFVYFRSERNDTTHQPERDVVYERFVKEFDGGIQRLYRIGSVDRLISETLLTAEEPPYVPQSQEAIDDHINMRTMADDAMDAAISARIKRRSNA